MSDQFNGVCTSQSYSVDPSDVPNEGILFKDHQSDGRSGHGGNCLAQCKNGYVVSFYSNVSGDIWNGHSVGGWSEYRISKDYGITWSEPRIFEYSLEAWQGDAMYSALVFGLLAAPDGALVAIVARFADEKWVKKLPPVYFLSHDQGETWNGPYEFDSKATVEDIALTFDAAFIHGDRSFIVFMGGAANMCPGPYYLYGSSDSGRSWQKISELPFHRENYYVTAGVLADGEIVVYSYPYRSDGGTDEHNLHVTISRDQGLSWEPVRTVFFAKKLRNPQLSESLNGMYFMHGRSGSHGEGKGRFVLYSSPDGLCWDEGIVLHGMLTCSDAYSANTVVVGDEGTSKVRLLIQSSISYESETAKVNVCQWWIQPD